MQGLIVASTEYARESLHGTERVAKIIFVIHNYLIYC
jgi:hypothetical protein